MQEGAVNNQVFENLSILTAGHHRDSSLNDAKQGHVDTQNIFCIWSDPYLVSLSAPGCAFQHASHGHLGDEDEGGVNGLMVERKKKLEVETSS